MNPMVDKLALTKLVCVKFKRHGGNSAANKRRGHGTLGLGSRLRAEYDAPKTAAERHLPGVLNEFQEPIVKLHLPPLCLHSYLYEQYSVVL